MSADSAARPTSPATWPTSPRGSAVRARSGFPPSLSALDDIADGAAQPGTSRWVKWWAEQVQGRGACHHPDGAVRMVRSALRVFAEDLTRHETGEPCLAGRLPETALSR